MIRYVTTDAKIPNKHMGPYLHVRFIVRIKSKAKMKENEKRK